jgi:hypothetical protein
VLDAARGECDEGAEGLCAFVHVRTVPALRCNATQDHVRVKR